jgi:hypothetical protein
VSEPLIPNGKPSLAQRVDPGRVAALEQQAIEQSLVLASRAMNDVINLANALHYVTQQALAGNAAARQQLTNFFQNLDVAKAAAAGITLPSKP